MTRRPATASIAPDRDPTHLQAARRLAMLSIAASLATLALKFGAWYLTGSVSLWSDALEGLVNLAAVAVTLDALTIASARSMRGIATATTRRSIAPAASRAC